MNKLILGDCLEVLQKIESESVDLVYIDPPFFSNRTYEVVWGDKGEIRSFEDRFSGGIDHYIAWLKERVAELHRILKPTGSIFLHCDWHADAYIRVHILDKVFGTTNFQNEIIWCYKTRANSTSRFNRKHDNIYFYSKSSKFIFNHLDLREDLSENTILKYRLIDENGRRYRLCGRGIKGSPIKSAKDVDQKWEKTNPELTVRVFLDERLGMTSPDYWEIDLINQQSKERIGYPTQKPEKLLERIIQCASNEGDTILDCFMGGGTTIAVADRLGRNWIGIDQSVQAIKVTEFRLNKQQGLFSKPFAVQLHKYDYDLLRYKDAFEFESFIITQFGGQPQNKKGGDKGIDGKAKNGAPIQVKRSDDIGVNVVKNFFVSAKQYDKNLFEKHQNENLPVGFIIAFSFGKGAIQEVARLKNEENVIIELLLVENIVPIAKKPTLKIDLKDLGINKNLREIEFVAKAESKAGIEFYAWDFNFQEVFNPEILLDKTGTQKYFFKAGEHQIAVKVVDNEGLENIEILKLKVNGKIERN